jgi:hypothetical protein
MNQPKMIEQFRVDMAIQKLIQEPLKKLHLFVENVIHFLPALSLDGIIAVDIMEGGCTKEKFKEFVISQVVRYIII